jgi:hypothetical protein
MGWRRVRRLRRVFWKGFLGVGAGAPQCSATGYYQVFCMQEVPQGKFPGNVDMKDDTIFAE